MQPTDRPRIGIVGAAPWQAQGLAAALADAARWELVMLGTERLRGEMFDACVLQPQEAGEAEAWLPLLPPALPRVWVGAAPTTPQQAATAHLGTDAGAAQLRAALAAVLAGLSVRPAADAWPPSAPAAGWPADAAEALTARELEVFELLAKGLSNRDIAGVLGISAHTAKFHVAQILAKVGAATRAEAVALGLRLGLIGL
ncbi:MAG: helix-turn-helix transcriptional regulator [Rubrivivax sp.]|nr:helix-turn-helix transcriptional regulator [Rubrivivax sp.]